MHSTHGIGARVGARVRWLVQGLGGLYKGFGVGIRVWCWCEGCNTLLKTLEHCFDHISPISEPFYLKVGWQQS
jgi:hypothetical protein